MSAGAWVPEACTLPTAEQPLRIAEFDALFATAVRPAERVGGLGVRIFLPVGAERTARDLVARESRCCSFFTFELRGATDGVELLVRVPSTRTAVLDALYRRAEQARAGA